MVANSTRDCDVRCSIPKIFQSGIVEAPLLIERVVQHKNGLIRCHNNMTGRDVTLLFLWCDISVKQHYKVVIIPPVTRRYRPDMTSNVLKGDINPHYEKINKWGVRSALPKVLKFSD